MKKVFHLNIAHFESVFYWLFTILYVILAMTVLIVLFQDGISFVWTFIFCLITALFILTLLNMKTTGLYINENKIYYKIIKKHYIDIRDINGIKVIESYGGGGKYSSIKPLTDRKHNQLYTIFLLKSTTQDMEAYIKGDVWFHSKFRKNILCKFIYNEDVVNYLLELKPEIIVMSQGSQGLSRGRFC